MKTHFPFFRIKLFVQQRKEQIHKRKFQRNGCLTLEFNKLFHFVVGTGKRWKQNKFQINGISVLLLLCLLCIFASERIRILIGRFPYLRHTWFIRWERRAGKKFKTGQRQISVCSGFAALCCQTSLRIYEIQPVKTSVLLFSTLILHASYAKTIARSKQNWKIICILLLEPAPSGNQAVMFVTRHFSMRLRVLSNHFYAQFY